MLSYSCLWDKNEVIYVLSAPTTSSQVFRLWAIQVKKEKNKTQTVAKRETLALIICFIQPTIFVIGYEELGELFVSSCNTQQRAQFIYATVNSHIQKWEIDCLLYRTQWRIKQSPYGFPQNYSK